MAAKSAPSSRIQLNPQAIERRKRLVGLTAEDLERIASIKPIVAGKIDQLTAAFFDYLKGLEGGAALFKNIAVLDEARRLKHEHILAMASGEYGRDYVEQRMQLGMLYSKVGLDVQVFLGGFHHLIGTIGAEVLKVRGYTAQAFDCFMSLQKVAFLDIGVIVDVLIDERERTINEQQEAIREISTPCLQIRNRLLILPIIGMIDSQRAKQLTDNLLQSIRASRAKVVVMDITGVAAVDSKVANHIIQTVAAARLMGATTIVTGLSDEVAQSLVALGVDLTKVNTIGDLQGGLEAAERVLGYRMVTVDEGASQLKTA